uniref:Phytocyanin domain-containing protein n=1 Tax=Kalanchoe fedtschenkoi TaxID=63787 RepID=A0A7N0V0G7_KALFE
MAASSASSSCTLRYFSTLIITLSLALNTRCAPSEPAEFEVGGEHGWRVPDNNDTWFYTRWAADNRFHVGDSLSFVYHNDSVMVVEKYAYYHCNTSKPIYVFRDEGKTLIKLDRAGPFYFISGNSEHCKEGQRLEVDVMSDAPPHPIVMPPSSPAAPAPAPSSAFAVAESLPLALFAFFTAGLARLFASHH